jgi:hypothetical protein
MLIIAGEFFQPLDIYLHNIMNNLNTGAITMAIRDIIASTDDTWRGHAVEKCAMWPSHNTSVNMGLFMFTNTVTVLLVLFLFILTLWWIIRPTSTPLSSIYVKVLIVSGVQLLLAVFLILTLHQLRSCLHVGAAATGPHQRYLAVCSFGGLGLVFATVCMGLAVVWGCKVESQAYDNAAADVSSAEAERRRLASLQAVNNEQDEMSQDSGSEFSRNQGYHGRQYSNSVC